MERRRESVSQSEQSADFKTAKIISAPPPPPLRKKVSHETMVAFQAQDTPEIKAIKAELEAKEKREKLVQQVLQEGGFVINSYFSDADRVGLQNLSNKKSAKMVRGGGGQSSDIMPIREIEAQFGASLGGDRKAMKDLGVNEFIDIRRETKAVIGERVIPGEETKSGILGFFGVTKKAPDRVIRERTGSAPTKHAELVAGGSQENAVRFSYIVASKENYQDSGGRHGKPLTFSMLLPETLAKQFEAEIGKDPSVMRSVVEQATKEKLLKENNLDPSLWETPLGKGTSPKPPYEQWDAEPNGGKVYIQKEGQKGNIRQIKK